MRRHIFRILAQMYYLAKNGHLRITLRCSRHRTRTWASTSRCGTRTSRCSRSRPCRRTSTCRRSTCPPRRRSRCLKCRVARWSRPCCYCCCCLRTAASGHMTQDQRQGPRQELYDLVPPGCEMSNQCVSERALPTW